MGDHTLPPLPASNLLIADDPILVLPRLAVAIGLNEAMVLQQVRYWLGKSSNVRDGQLWAYNTYEAWQERDFPFWSVGTVKRTFLALEKSGLLIAVSRYNKMPTDRTKWYTIDFAKLAIVEAGILDRANLHVPTEQIAPMEERKMRRSSGSDRATLTTDPTEITQETETDYQYAVRFGAQRGYGKAQALKIAAQHTRGGVLNRSTFLDAIPRR